MTKRVVLISASPLGLSRLGLALDALDGITLVGSARDFASAYALIESHAPEIAVIGAELAAAPEMEGLSSLARMTRTATVEAIEDGCQPRLASSLRMGLRGPPLRDCLLALRPAPLPGHNGFQTVAPFNFAPERLILIGASTGGIDALQTILSAFPADCPPTAIVQHTGPAFSGSLIRLLARSCPARVLPAASGMVMLPGQVVVAAGAPGHLRLDMRLPARTRLEDGVPVSGHQPSVDELFRSAVPRARDVTAALLTGMGRDGARGMLALREAGAVTLAQDEASSVVWGMPRAAVELGAATHCLPLARMAPALLARCALEPQALAGRRSGTCV